MTDAEAKIIISRTAQRWIPAYEIDKFVDTLLNSGVAIDQVSRFSAEYITNNATVLQDVGLQRP